MKFGKFYVDFKFPSFVPKELQEEYELVYEVEDMVVCTIQPATKKSDDVMCEAYSFRSKKDKMDKFKGMRLAFSRALDLYTDNNDITRKQRKKLWSEFDKNFGHLELVTVTKGELYHI